MACRAEGCGTSSGRRRDGDNELQTSRSQGSHRRNRNRCEWTARRSRWLRQRQRRRSGVQDASGVAKSGVDAGGSDGRSRRHHRSSRVMAAAMKSVGPKNVRYYRRSRAGRSEAAPLYTPYHLDVTVAPTTVTLTTSSENGRRAGSVEWSRSTPGSCSARYPRSSRRRPATHILTAPSGSPLMR